MILKKVSWFFKRHHFLYTTRFKLLSKNSSAEDLEGCSYNASNPESDIPSVFKEINAIVFKDNMPSTDFEVVKQLSVWLQNNIKGGPGLSEASDAALKIMLAGKGGVCSDMAQIFNNFCVINGVKVREWGTTRAPFNKEFGGHSFNEIFSTEHDKWILIDVYNSSLFFHNNEIPLSVIELFELVRANKQLSFHTFNVLKPTDEANITKNYLDADTIPFLICNYSNKTYDSSLRLFRPHIPVFVIHFGLYVLQKSYYYRFPLDDYRRIFSCVTFLLFLA
ncbi:transglutaminase domain-containing protein [Lacinutrix sp. MEBiC02404]